LLHALAGLGSVRGIGKKCSLLQNAHTGTGGNTATLMGTQNSFAEL
jgi:hypothetical protein